jgi:hypothetical protein
MPASIAAMRRPCPLMMKPSSFRTTMFWSTPNFVIMRASREISSGGCVRGLLGYGLMRPSGHIATFISGFMRLPLLL